MRLIAACAVSCLVIGLLGADTSAQERPASAPPGAVTFDDILKLLELGIDERAILARLERSPTIFTLDQAQIEQLQRSGATPAILSALQKRRGPPEAANDVTDVAVLLDCSGSMLEKTSDDEVKMDVAKRVVADLVQNVPDGMRLTFVVYGHDKKLACQAVNVLRPLSELDAAGKSRLIAQIDALQPAGSTPIALALRTAAQELGKSDSYCSLVVISDGKETCKGNPATEAAQIATKLKVREGFGVNVVGFDVGQDRGALEAIAQAGRGAYHQADTAEELSAALASLSTELQQAAAPVEQRSARKYSSAGAAVQPGSFFHDAAAIGAGEYKGSLAFMDAHYYQVPVRKGQEIRAVGIVQKSPYEAGNGVNHQTFSVTIYRSDLQVAARELLVVKDNPTSPAAVRAVWQADFDGTAYVAIAASDNHASGQGYAEPVSVWKPEKPEPSRYTLRIRVEGEASGEPPGPTRGDAVSPGTGFDDAAPLRVGELAAADLKLGEVAFFRVDAPQGQAFRVVAGVQKPWYNAGNYRIRARYTLTAYDDDQVQVAQQSLEISHNPPDGHGLALEFRPTVSGAAYVTLSCENAGAEVYPEDFDPLPGRIAVRVDLAANP